MLFIDRFDIEVSSEDTRQKFRARAINEIFYPLEVQPSSQQHAARACATALGRIYIPNKQISGYYAKEFFEVLQCIEAIYELNLPVFDSQSVENAIKRLFSEAETDLGIRWEAGKFYPKGAILLDEKLVNDQLQWLRRQGVLSVLDPFEKALKHLLSSQTDPSLLPDVITDAYESLEGLSKIVTGRHGQDLSANRELFVSALQAPDELKKLLKSFVDFAQKFRHASKPGENKPNLRAADVEFYIYVTGAVIRLSIECGAIQSS